MTIYNFSAGPAVLPKPVLEQAQREMLDYQGSGMSVLEMSHRSKEFDHIIKEAERLLRELMAIPDIGDIIELPIRAEDDINSFDTDCYVIRQKIIYKNSIDYFCELYDWEASYEN